MSRVTLQLGTVLLGLGLAASGAHAQLNNGLELVAEGEADVSPLGTANRLVPVDLRVPTNFEQVYRLPTVVGPAMFARIDGGLTAVFPQSVYRGTQALIPAGTTWYLGTLPEHVLRGEAAAVPLTEVAQAQRPIMRPNVPTAVSLASALPGAAALETQDAAWSHPMPWAGDFERSARVADLLRRAAGVRSPS